jgi:hypothetical protein
MFQPCAIDDATTVGGVHLKMREHAAKDRSSEPWRVSVPDLARDRPQPDLRRHFALYVFKPSSRRAGLTLRFATASLSCGVHTRAAREGYGGLVFWREDFSEIAWRRSRPVAGRGPTGRMVRSSRSSRGIDFAGVKGFSPSRVKASSTRNNHEVCPVSAR